MTKTLTLTSFENYILWFAMTKSKIVGTSAVDDLDNIYAARKLFVSPPFEGEKSVELPQKLVAYVRAALSALPVGEMVRTDDLPDAIASVREKLKE